MSDAARRPRQAVPVAAMCFPARGSYIPCLGPTDQVSAPREPRGTGAGRQRRAGNKCVVCGGGGGGLGLPFGAMKRDMVVKFPGPIGAS